VARKAGVQPHVQLRKLLGNAKGEPEFVIAAVLDIRGFSSFAMKVDSVQAAAYLRRAYMRIIDRYLPSSKFYKLTGDGLLVVFPCEDNVERVAAAVLKSFVRLVSDFPNLCEGDPLINFDVPRLLGVGLSRGAATRLVSNGITLDYSGRPLNAASKLMDLARPSGLVLDHSYGADLIPKDMKPLFGSAKVYLKGISDGGLTRVYYTKGNTKIPASAMVVPEARWRHVENVMTISDWKSYSKQAYYIGLPSLARGKDDVVMSAEFTTPTDIARHEVSQISVDDFNYVASPKPRVVFQPRAYVNQAVRSRARESSAMKFMVDYLVG
jgi:class 3 adenylate cyclase